jgi:hypothetical protein
MPELERSIELRTSDLLLDILAISGLNWYKCLDSLLYELERQAGMEVRILLLLLFCLGGWGGVQAALNLF